MLRALILLRARDYSHSFFSPFVGIVHRASSPPLFRSVSAFPFSHFSGIRVQKPVRFEVCGVIAGRFPLLHFPPSSSFHVTHVLPQTSRAPLALYLSARRSLVHDMHRSRVQGLARLSGCLRAPSPSRVHPPLLVTAFADGRITRSSPGRASRRVFLHRLLILLRLFSSSPACSLLPEPPGACSSALSCFDVPRRALPSHPAPASRCLGPRNSWLTSFKPTPFCSAVSRTSTWSPARQGGSQSGIIRQQRGRGRGRGARAGASRWP